MTATGTRVAPLHRSYSQISQLRTCGWQYKLERIDRVASRPGVPAEAGKAIHVASEEIDKLLLNGNADSTALVAAGQTAADASLDEAIAKHSATGWDLDSWKVFGKQDLAWFRSTGIPNSLTSYVTWRLNGDLQVAEVPGFGPAIEVPFEYYVTPGRAVRGFIDRIFVNEQQQTLLVADLKSGKKPETDEQLAVYARALSDVLEWEVTHGFYVYAMKTGDLKVTEPIDLRHWTQEKLARAYEPASQTIESGLFVPNPGEHCWFKCSVSHACEFRQAVI